MECIILAGHSPPADKAKIEQREAAEGEKYLWGGEQKALIELEDLEHKRFRPIDRVLEAVQSSRGIRDYVVVGSSEVGDYLPDRRFIPQGKSIGENIRLGLEALTGEGFALVLFSDLVMTTKEVLDELVNNASNDLHTRRPQPAQVVSYVDKRTMGNFPRRYLPFWKEGRHIWGKEGNFLFVTPRTRLETIDMIYSNRKLMEGSSQRGLVSYIAEKCPGQLAAGVLEIILSGGLWSQTFNNGFARLFGEERVEGSYPNILFENLWRELQMDLDSEQDAARLGLTIVGNLEHKLRVGPDSYGRALKLCKIYQGACQKVMLEPDAAKFDAHFLVTRWQSRGEYSEFESRNMQKISRLSEGMEELGWYGEPSKGG